MELNEIKDLILKAKESNATTLDLSFKRLTSLPSEIEELKNLTTLDISFNKLSSLPPEIKELKNLTTLNISGNQLSSLPPETTQLKNLTKLYISSNQLSSLPPETTQLKNLTTLNISGNQLTSLPPEIAQLKNLIILDISFNHLSSLPPEVTQLKNLTELDISNNQLSSLPSEIAQLKNLIILDISSNQLTSLPPEIKELKNLKTLNIYKNQLTSLPPEISELKNLTQLDISNNRLPSLPSEIFGLKNLTHLYIRNSHLTSLPSEIVKLKNLTQLSIPFNELTSLPPEIAELKNLTHLYISGNHLTSLPSEITELKNLTELYISENQLTSFPSEILILKNIEKLDLSGNKLSSLPSEIAELKNLTHLYISRNHLTSLPSEITELKNLTELYISENQLTSFPSEILILKNIEKLDLSGNKLSSLPSEIAELKNLTGLDICGNQLSSLPSEISRLNNLTILNISGNQLTSLPSEILLLGLDIEWMLGLDLEDEFRLKSKTVLLESNPFENPPVEIIKQGREAIINYFKSLESEKKPLNEVKVLLVGEGNAGKTSLVKRIFGEEVDGNEPQTQGINIRKLPVNNGDRKIKANFWDFGGQEIMHATHQFFLSKRSLYILVLDGRKDEKPEYWLKLIENFGGDSPVLVVINKIDENPAFELNRKFLQEKYPSIRGFYRLSCKSNEGLQEFSKALQEELTKVKHLEIKWPKSWFNVKNKLDKMCPNCPSIEGDDGCEHCNFIEYKEYKEICVEEGIRTESEQNTLVGFLNDLGVILHFKDIPLLNTHVLEPEWVTNAVYRIVNSRKIADSRGILKPDEMLPEILKQNIENKFYYPPDQYGFIINLMKKFELSYDLDNHTILLPSLLEIEEPNFKFDYEGALRFIIDYDFLPPSVMPRFIVKMSGDIKGDLRWRTGVVLEDEDLNSSAVVRADNEAKRISIYVNGKQRRDYFAFIRKKFREINNSFEKLKATEKIPLPDKPEVNVSYKHLIKLEQKGIEDYMPDGSDKEYRVSDLLGTVINWNSERALLEEIWQITEANKSNEKEILNNEKEILKILRTLQEIGNEFDTEDTLLEKANNVFSIQPTVFGVGVNLNEIVKLYLKRRKIHS